MSYFTDKHIQEFLKGQVIAEVVVDKHNRPHLIFESGEQLRLLEELVRDGAVHFVLPLNPDGDVKQQKEIMGS